MNNPLIIPPFTVRLSFFLCDTYRHYIPLPDFTEPILLSDETYIRDGICIEVSYFDCLESTSILVFDTLTAMGIPTRLQDGIMTQIHSYVMYKLQISGYTKIISLRVMMQRIHLRPYDYREAHIMALLRDAGICLPIPASESSIDGLTRIVFRVGVQDPGSCSVCLEDFEDGVSLIQMPCSHLYHQDCIVQWLKSSHLCPLCRYQMPTNHLSEPLHDSLPQDQEL